MNRPAVALVLGLALGFGAQLALADGVGTGGFRPPVGGGGSSSGVASVSVTAPITSTGGSTPNLGCTMATTGTAGCVSATTQFFTGTKVFEGLIAGYAVSNYAPSMNASIDLTAGAATAGPIFPSSNDNEQAIIGRRQTGLTADVRVTGQRFRDGGIVMAVAVPGCPGSNLLAVTTETVSFGDALDRNCSSSSDPKVASLLDNSTLSGHAALRRAPGFYLQIEGDISNLVALCAIETDGGRPVYDGGPWVSLQPDGGACYSYAGLHGNNTFGSSSPMYAGQIAEFKNPLNGDFNDHRAGIDMNGAYWQNHGLTYAQFPSPAPDNMLTSLGQFRHMLQSTMMFDFGETPGGHRWYYARVNEDAGSEWVQFAHQAPVYGPAVLVNGVLTAGATLGGWTLPSNEQPLLDAINFYVGASGTGGSTDAIIRASWGGNTCDFTFACNASTGVKRIQSPGTSGCAPTWGYTITWTAQSIGDCAVGPTLTGNLTPELRWR